MFKRATRTQRPLKLAIFGVSGSGKTYTALQVMRNIVGPDGKVAVIDTERSSASVYADKWAFDVASLTQYDVDSYVAMIEAAKDYDGLIIDSGSHAWEGRGGILELVDDIGKSKKYKGDFQAWGDVKPHEDKLWSAVLDSPCHTIMTLRAKTQYEVGRDSEGKVKIEKLGLGPIQRANKEYEFDVVASMDRDNVLIIEKTRCEELVGGVFAKPNGDFSAILKRWCAAGAPTVVEPPAQTMRDVTDDAAKKKQHFKAMCEIAGEENARQRMRAFCEAKGSTPTMAAVTLEEMEEMLDTLHREVALSRGHVKEATNA